MSNEPSILDIPKEPAIRRAWVCYQLRIRGNSIRNLAKQIGVSMQAVSAALMTPSIRIERAIAEAIGVPPETLFAERYDKAGNRIARTRPDKLNTASAPGNVQPERAA